MNFSTNEKDIIITNNNKSNNNPLFLTKMLKPNKKNRSKFNKSKNYFSKKLSYNTKNNDEINSFYSHRDIDFINELLIKIENNNPKKINLKDLLKDRKISLGNEGREILKKNNYIYFTNKNINRKKNSSNKRRINSARPLFLDSNKRLTEIENLINLRQYNDEIPKILAFKENILVHVKNISLLNNNNKNNTDEINQKNKNYNIDYNKNLGNYQKNKNNTKYKRPKSAIYEHSTYNNLKIKNLKQNDVAFNNLEANKKDSKYIPSKTDKIFDDQYYDLSYINNSNRKENNKEKKENNKFKINKEIMFPSNYDYFSYSPSDKNLSKYNGHFLYQQNYSNIDNNSNLLFNSKIKMSNKINRGHMFRRRPIPIINEKYLIYLPRNIKKDINNKYNFFSYLLTENIYYNTEDKYNLYKYKNIKKNKNKKNFSSIKKNNNKIKYNYTEYNLNKNNEKNNNEICKLNCRKEEDFMSYLKNLDYIKKHPNKFKDQNLNDIFENYSKKIIKSDIDKKNNIYKPVKIKIENSTPFEAKQRNKNKLYDNKKVSSEEESELCEIIKSQPFKNKRKATKFNL